MIQKAIHQSIAVKQSMLDNTDLILKIEQALSICIDTFRSGGKVLLCGNGGSAADAQHIAAELSGRFKYDRPPLFSEALHVNSSFVTAVANDYSFDKIFSRMTEAMGRKNDVLIALSTSGNSINVVNAVLKAQEIGMHTIGLTGEGGGQLKHLCEILINVPSHDTARIQEAHILIGHILCESIEQNLFPEQDGK